MQNEQPGSSNDVIQLPSPTVWPMLLALGIALLSAGMVTNAAIGLLGVLLAAAGSVGWFFQVLPNEAQEPVEVCADAVLIASARTLPKTFSADATRRKILPIETFKITSGIKGGIAGGAAMTVPAAVFSLIRYHSIWYAVNLLGGAGVAGWSNPTLAEITHFRLSALIFATIIHVVGSLLVGLLYGAMLPMLPRHPVLLGGIIAPLLWTGVLHATLGLINPYLDARIDWWWFVASQVTFGLVAGWVVGKQIHIRTEQYLPFAARVGLETPGMMEEDNREDGPK